MNEPRNSAVSGLTYFVAGMIVGGFLVLFFMVPGGVSTGTQAIQDFSKPSKIQNYYDATEITEFSILHGNTRSYIFHQSTCQHYWCKNCTEDFTTREAAISAGYRACKVCRP